MTSVSVTRASSLKTCFLLRKKNVVVVIIAVVVVRVCARVLESGVEKLTLLCFSWHHPTHLVPILNQRKRAMSSFS